MRAITWLHLSDLHFRMSNAYNMDVVLEAFLKDIPRLLAEDGLHPDFLAVTGDIAFSGKAEEYELAWRFLDGLREQLNDLPKERLFIVPGNHDVNRDAITPVARAAIAGLDDPDKVNEFLGDTESLRVLLKKFHNYAAFLQNNLKGHLRFNEQEYFFVRTFELSGKQIAIMGLNSAWASVSDDDDKVKLLVGERQVREAVRQAGQADICLALMHHPFELLKPCDRDIAEAKLAQNSHFILRGHRHDTKLVRQLEPDAEVIVLSAGACYQERREFNSCNCVSLDPEAGRGTVFLYAYSDKRGGQWVKDTFTYPELRNGEWPVELHTLLTGRHAPTRPAIVRSRPALDSRLFETRQLYMRCQFELDKFAQLDQAGETDLERGTLLPRVFVDLEARLRPGPQPRVLTARGQLALFPELSRSEEGQDILALSEDKVLSAMDFFMNEQWPMVALIGGPGTGKSTLGQYLAQVHRATLLGCTSELYEGIANHADDGAVRLEPRIPRLPFRVVLKYFARWLSKDPRLDSVEAYLAEQVHEKTQRAISPEDIQRILCSGPCLMIFDGLDEVTQPKIRNRMLARLREFLGRADQLRVNLQVLATSRPAGYSDQFDPGRFVHLNLLPLSPDRVSFYARRWTRAKVLLDEERQRILETLAECQEDEQVRLLLTSPLQVTIVLLIIKDGGHPPRQREALFNEYWGTIFRREKAKAEWVIRSPESSLFDLHAYLAYLLHRRAAGEEISSLLPEAEFRAAVQSFLRQKDSLRSNEEINRLAAQLVGEARNRLVLLVEPQSGFFGFELRPLQEFFAASYLAQTARDTSQRFERFKAIARLDHWHNVALFLAGRIVRTVTGEAANVLELVCRPIDRESPDYYLRRGAWLALDIAADGAFAGNRDLQYAAVEYGLSVLKSGLSDRQRERLQTALGQLPPEDQRDILRPVLKDQLRALPPSCLQTALDLCGQYIKSDQISQDSMYTCLATGKPVDILVALDLAVQYQADPSWLAKQLQRYWPVWSEIGGGRRLQEWLSESPEYIRNTFLAWSPSDEQIDRLLDDFLAGPWGWYGIEELAPEFLLGELESPLSQAVATLESCNLVLSLPWSKPPGEAVDVEGMGTFLLVNPSEVRRESQAALEQFVSTDRLKSQIQSQLSRSDLLPHLRASIWLLYWALNEPTPETAASFLDDIGKIAKNFPLWLNAVSRLVYNWWPLLATAVDRLIDGDLLGAKRLIPLLGATSQLDIVEQVVTALRGFVHRASEEQLIQLWESIQIYDDVGLPELTRLAETSGIRVEELVQIGADVTVWSSTTFSSDFLQRALIRLENLLCRPNYLKELMWYIVQVGTWSVNPEIIERGQHLLVAMLERWDEYPKELRQGIVCLFLKLLSHDCSTLEESPSLLAALARAQDWESGWLWRIAHAHTWELSPVCWAGLAEFVTHSDNEIREGALKLWEAVVRPLDTPSVGPIAGIPRPLRIDWRIGWELLAGTNQTRRQRGIALLAFSNFPVGDEAPRMALLDMMAACQGMAESTAWACLIQNIAVPDAQKMQWRQLLEAVLSQPQRYTQAILAAAMERYMQVAGQIGPDIPVDEGALGLPSGP